jgi:cation diffusion facilitator CzcD-associated flavoprotein CzcO
MSRRSSSVDAPPSGRMTTLIIGAGLGGVTAALHFYDRATARIF